MGYHAIIEMLTKNLGQGKVDLQLKDGKTALMLACKNGYAESVEELLNSGADPELKENDYSRDGFSAIMHAALYGHDKCIAVVVRHVKKKIAEEETAAATSMQRCERGRQVRQPAHTACDPSPTPSVPEPTASSAGRCARQRRSACPAARHGNRQRGPNPQKY